MEGKIRVVAREKEYRLEPVHLASSARRFAAGVFFVALLFHLRALCFGATPVEFKDAQDKYLSGDYARCIKLSRQGLAESDEKEQWQLLLTSALLTTGEYPDAREVITNALRQDRWSLRLRWQAREVFRRNGQPEAGAEMLDNIIELIRRHPRDYHEPPDLVVAGQVALAAGEDPKLILTRLFDPARKAQPKLREVYLASGGLALEKHDFALAARTFEQGLKELPDDPDLLCGLAHAYAPSDQSLMLTALEAALERNSNHVGSLLLLADYSIDAEDYAQANRLLDRVKRVNPWEPDAWAYRAVLAHLRGQTEPEKQARHTALKFWPADPRVDYLIGRKLAQNYRFVEGAAHQRQALGFDHDYLPAKAQLAQDLMRLGQEDEGWKLAEEVQKTDGYDVQAYNLTTLRRTLEKFTTLTNGDFLVRMSAHEAALYGQNVLELLVRARTTLCAKYGLEVKRPTIVEVFPDQKDFAVRTFGMPADPGYLGVCFGSVVTANSPAAHPADPANWQAVLWHEFCHVVTLQLTRNKMPRWLSEGISVYEEMQADPSWGQRMTPRYREMVLGDDLTPISRLSGAFLAPRSELDLQFAYYESSLAVEFVVQRFGLDALKSVLGELAKDVEINSAIERHTESMTKLEEDFAAFARERAQQLAPGLDWEKPNVAGAPNSALLADSGTNSTNGPVRPRRGDRRVRPRDSETGGSPQLSSAAAGDAFQKWVSLHPTNYYALTLEAEQLLVEKKFEQAKAPLRKLTVLYPGQTGPESAWALLAAACRELGQTNEERQVLSRLAKQDDEAKDAYARLMELDAAAQDWPAVATAARQYLAVDPLTALPYRYLAQAAEHTADTTGAIQAYRGWLQLDPADPAEVHFRLARLLHSTGSTEARRQVLLALEQAPRYPAALQLLLAINQQTKENSGSAGAEVKP